MKRYKSIIIALVVIVVAVAAFFALDSFVLNDDGEAKSTNSPDDITGMFAEDTELLFDVESEDNIVKYECNIVDNIVLERNENKKWFCSTYTDVPVIHDAIDNDINQVIGSMATVVYEGEITEDTIQNYGISNLKYVKLTLDDGSVYTLCYGMQKQGSSSCFAMIKEKNKIYLLNTTHKDYTIITLENIINSDIFDFSDNGKIKYIYVEKNGEKFIELTATLQKDGRTWDMQYPIKNRGEDPHIEEVLSIVTLMKTQEYIEGDCQELSKYGLEIPVYSMSLADSENVQKVNIGNISPEGDAYYCTVGNDNNVFTIAKESLQFIDDPEIKYINTYLHMQISQEIYKVLKTAEVDISCDGYSSSFVLGFEIDDNTEKRYYESVLMETKEEINAFKHLNTSIYELNLVGLDDEPKEKGELLITVKYTCEDGVYEIKGYRRDETTMYLYMNDIYCGGYDYIRQVTGSSQAYGIKGSLEELQKILA